MRTTPGSPQRKNPKNPAGDSAGCRSSVSQDGSQRPAFGVRLQTELLRIACAVPLIFFASATLAFSLLGPYADWMSVEKGYRQPQDIGGPMNINEGYRWNVPVLTYGFDRSFLDYFGSNGVAAVEEAVKTFNEIPPASQMDLNAFALNARRYNYAAESLAIIDLKTKALAALLEEMGLADPTRFMFCVHDYQNYGPWNNAFQVVIRNFDPASGLPSHYVNGVLFSYQVIEYAGTPVPGQLFCDASEVPVDAEADVFSPVLSFNTPYIFNPWGAYVTNLTLEDVAGLKFLLDGNQVRCESLPPDVHLANTNDGPLVVTADRPGIDKITLVRHPTGTLNGQFLPLTNRWTDVYYGYYTAGFQEVERITTHPDVLFTARDLGPDRSIQRTGTTNWVNNAELNGNDGGPGPGVIEGPVTIAFNSIGPFHELYGRISTNAFLTELDAIPIAGWGSFNGATTNAPILYPAGRSPFRPTEVHLDLSLGGVLHDLHWPIAGQPYRRFSLQTATNFTDWTTLRVLTNSGAPFDYNFEASSSERTRFFRTVQQ